IENTLNEYPQLASGNSSSVNSGGGSGVLTANLRGLGSTRTLVLVNNRRFIPADSNGQVDLSSIPDALVERVEVITGGASAVYGSDAIAGVVNVILKDDFSGFETSYLFGETFKGDGTSHKIDATFGANLEDGRGNVTLSASYTKRDPVFMADRSFSRVPLDTIGGTLVPGGSGNIPGTRIGLSTSQLASLNGVNLTPSGPCTGVNGIRFGQNGTPLPFCNPEDRYNYAALNYLLRPLERIQVTGLAHYDITDNVTAYGEAFYINNRNEFQQAPDSFRPVTPGAASGTLLIPNFATNPILLPAVRTFFSNNRALFDSDGDGTAEIVGAGRRADELGPRNYAYERASVNFTAGLRGKLPLLGREWSWDGFLQYQRTRTDQRREGFISQTRLGQALNAVTTASGQVVCADASRGCVPVSIFGLGSITPAAGAFLTPPRVDSELFNRKIAGVSLSGALFDLPAGPVALALGGEYREDKYRFSPSPQDLAGEYADASESPLGGKYDLKEVFGELRIPIFKDRPFADSLAIEGAARYSDYSSIGSAFTWKLGGEYAPIKWLRIRGAYNRAIRAPAIGELFAPVARGFSSGDDPCARSANPTAAQQQLCIAQGIRAADLPTFEQTTVGFDVLSGGNPNLQEEKSKTYTIGAVISPPFMPKLNLTVDYFNVKVDNAVSSIGPNQTLDDCFRRLDPNAPT
ncbi:MAG: TonB-dependent receptor plug domain-containing protein, partial [Sphingomonadaceae bacterium]